jgi:hypothetical protein
LPYNYPASQFINIGFGGIPNQNFAGSTGYAQFPYKTPIRSSIFTTT